MAGANSCKEALASPDGALFRLVEGLNGESRTLAVLTDVVESTDVLEMGRDWLAWLWPDDGRGGVAGPRAFIPGTAAMSHVLGGLPVPLLGGSGAGRRGRRPRFTPTSSLSSWPCCC